MLRGQRRHRIETYLKRLYGYAYSLTYDAERARELVHDCVVKALSAHRVPRDEPAFRAWLFKILRNAATDRARRGKRMLDTVPECHVESDEAWAHWSETEEVNALTVRISFARLTAPQREILAAIDIAGFSYAEASDLFGVPVGTIMSRISRARSALYKIVEETSDDSKLRFLPVRKRNSAR